MSVTPDKYGEYGLTEKKLVDMLRKMIEIRRFEEKVEELFLVKGVLSGPSHLYYGQEAVAVGVISALKEDDPIVSTYRGHGHAIARGVPMRAIMAELFGRREGTCKGLGGSMHAAISLDKNIPLATAIVGSGIPIAVGMAFAIMYANKANVVASFFGDGAVNTGSFHEGMNLAGIWKLPVIFVCENNLYSEFTRIDRTLAGGSIASRASSYGMDGLVVDGNDVLAVYTIVFKLREHVARGKPVLIECKTYRRKGHGVYDKALYRPKEEVQDWLKKDPIDRLAKRLVKEGIIDDKELKEIDEQVKEEVNDAVNFIDKSQPLSLEEAKNFVYV